MLKPSRFGIVVVGALLIAILGARPYAASWNDGSRLATVESLVDRHTWAIDDSIFVKVPAQDALNPYATDVPSTGGTMDKMLIGGHFYSDKPPVAALWLAGVYWVAQTLTGFTAAADPHIFVYLMTVTSSGLSYVIAVLCIWFLARRLALSESAAFLVTLSLGAATLAPVYARQVNNNIMLLAALAAIFLVADTKEKRPALLGLLVGLAYTLDLGLGPVLVLATLLYAAVKWRTVASPLVCALAMLPFIALHHWLNYRIGGTVGPANANPRFFDYPGTAFTAENMTGSWAHGSILDLLEYAVGLLVGPHGFLLFNLPLLLIPFGVFGAWRALPERRPELLYAGLICCGTWALYATASNNYSGLAASIRWFVPLLAPAYVVLMLTLKARPGLREPFKVLTEFGFVLTAALFWIGPWRNPNPLLFWTIVTLALLAFAWSLWRARAVPGNVTASI